ncbi:MAG: hypothetical protein IID32_03530 [Planctomycetes bacterium]|nr:hypothetical protein [Planctomycetota bacterium]
MQTKKIRWSLAIVIILLAVGLTTEKLTKNAKANSHLASEKGHDHAKHSVIETNMDILNKSYRLLRKQISDKSKNQSTIALINKMQVSALTAATQSPSMAKKIPPAKRGKFNLAFKRTMVSFVVTLMDIEEALLNSDNVKAKQAYLKLGAIKKKGHDNFKEEEE